MNYKLSWKDFVIVALVIITSLFGCLNYSYSNLADQYQTILETKDFKFDSLLNVNNQIVAEKQVLETTNKEDIKKLSEEVFSLTKREEKRIKEVHALVRAIQNIRVTNTYIPYIDSTVDKSDSFYTNDSLVHKDSVVIPPRTFKNSTKNYVIDGTVLLKGVNINSIYLPDTLSFRIAEQRPKGIVNRILKPNETVVQAIHTNKLFETNGLQAITLKQKTNAWNRFIKPGLFMLGGGFITYKVLK